MADIDFLRVHAEGSPERPALILGDRVVDFATLSGRADRAAHVFTELGCEPQDRIAIMSFNSISGSEIANGARRSRAVVVPVNYRLRGSEVAYVLNDSGARVVCADADHVDVVDAARPELKGERHYIATGSKVPDGWTSYEDLMRAASRADDEHGQMLTGELQFDLSADDQGLFLAEVDELLQRFEESLVDLERAPDDRALLNEIFRAAHTIKGSSATIGHARMAALTHAMETRLDDVRKGIAAVTPQLIEALLKAVDVLKLLRDEVETRVAADVDVDAAATAVERRAGLRRGSADRRRSKKSLWPRETFSGVCGLSAGIAARVT